MRVILYLDTSALVKLYIAEAESPAIHDAVARAEAVAVCRIAWAEACAALARRARDVPTDETATTTARHAMARDWPHFLIIEVTQAVVERACEFAETFALRGYDSVQLASAYTTLASAPGEVDFACYDNRLNKAARVLGLSLLNTP